MLDRFDRKIDYLRISVTDRCDHRCIYCMPDSGIALKGHDDILTYEQITDVAGEAVLLGVRKVRLTGGEPLIRRGVASLVRRLDAIAGIEDLCMTTNGTQLASMAADLKAAGLDRVNISIDSLDPDRYRKITRGAELNVALRGVAAAIDAGLTPIKINMVILEDTTDSEVADMRHFCDQRGIALQRIMQFSLYDRQDVGTRLRTERPPGCADCNRLRLTADGFLKPCLFSEDEIRIDFNNIRDSLLAAVAGKPENGSACHSRHMSQIGG